MLIKGKTESGVHAFLKTPEAFSGPKAMLCAGYLPTEILFSFVLKANQ